MLNVGQFIDLMKHALGKTPDARHNLYATFNRAGRKLYTEHDWNFRTQGMATLPAIANQAYLELPSDWGGLLQATVPNSGNFSFLQPTSLAELLLMRSYTVVTLRTGVTRIYWPSYSTQATVEDQPTKRAELFPTPTTAGDPTVTAYYTRVWANVAYDPVAGTGDDDAIPNLPDEFEEALIRIARESAWSLENQQPSIDGSLYQAEIERLKLEDARAQTVYGRAVGGASSRARGHQLLDFSYPQRASL